MNLGKNTIVRSGLDYASGSADRNGAEFDMQGFEGVLMIFKFAAIAAGAVTSIKAQQDTVTGMGSAADIEGTAQAVAADDDDQIFVIDLYRPRERFVRGVVDKDASNATAEVLVYVGYGARKMPTSMALTDEVSYELHVSPAEGTA